MYRKRIYCMIVCLSAMLPISAQYSRNQVEILDMDNSTSVFSAEGFGRSKDEALENAYKAILYKVLYEGVEGFNDNKPIVASPDYQRTNLWLKDFFDGKTASYKVFRGGMELIGDFKQHPTDGYQCHANILIKHDMLLRQASSHGVTQQQNQPLRQVEPTEQETQEAEPKPAPQKKSTFLEKKKGFL